MNKKIRWALGITSLVTIILLTLTYWLNKEIQKSRADSFVVGIAADYAPYVSINKNGQYEGFDIDIAHEVAKLMGKTLVLEDFGSMTPLFIALEQGTIDTILWGISITTDRMKKLDFVRYQGETETTFPLIFWDKIPENITRFADMAGMRICVEPASAQAVIAQKYAQLCEIIFVEKVDDAFLMVQQHKVDAAFIDPVIAKKFCKKYPACKQLAIPLAPEDQVHGIGMPVKKENIELREKIQEAIDTLRTSRRLEILEKVWGLA